jgi:anti-sigma factor RsiW
VRCEQAEALIEAYADRELPAALDRELAEHLGECVQCAANHQALLDLRRALKTHTPLRAPPHLRERIEDGLRDAQAKSIDRVPVWRQLWPSAASLVFGAALSWGLLTLQFGQRDQDQALDQVVAAHVRSLMADHITDIASSDGHTVKPWFNGKLDFSPPVHDFTLDGYPLLGGRLDYLEGHVAAALVYRHRQHVINLFIRPRLPGDAPVTQNRNGYHLLQWQSNGLHYYAVSDLNLEDLRSFTRLLQDKATPPTRTESRPSPAPIP